MKVFSHYSRRCFGPKQPLRQQQQRKTMKLSGYMTSWKQRRMNLFIAISIAFALIGCFVFLSEDTSSLSLNLVPPTSELTASAITQRPTNSTIKSNSPIDAKAEARPRTKKMYSYVRGDRSGASIQDMLMANAYAYQEGAEYGGACARDFLQKFSASELEPRKVLLKSVGLESILPFDCPKSPKVKLLNRKKYIAQDTAIFTSAYIKNLHESLHASSRTSKQQITVHIRRGDITPCRPRTRGFPRYLPNLHYLKLIERYYTPNTNVVIYSESESFEPFDAFRDLGYTVVLDGNIEDVWKSIVFDSSVVILSRSSFSFVPAILSNAPKIVYTPFWHQPLPHWQDLGHIDPDLVNSTQAEFRRLKRTCPPKHIRKRDEMKRKKQVRLQKKK